MTRKRAISSITGETNQPSSLRTHQKANKVPCHCSKCKGKLGLKRTKLLHESGNTNESESHSSSSSSNIPELEIIEAELPQKDTDDDSISTSANMRREITHSDVYSMSSIQRVIGAKILQIGTEEELSDVDVDIHINPEYFIASRMRVRRYIDRAQTTIEEGSESEEDETSDSGDENEPPISAEIFEDYSTPNFDPYNIEEVTVNENFLWILLWIMKFRTKFNIPETATESLIKFMKLVLNEIGGDDFKDFPDSLFSAKQTLGLKERFQSFVPCTKCHKLYLKKEVEHFCQGETLTIMKC